MRQYWVARVMMTADAVPDDAVALSVGAPCPACGSSAVTILSIDYVAKRYGCDNALMHEAPRKIVRPNGTGLVVTDYQTGDVMVIEGVVHGPA